ncbi:MAG: response regulator, partial [Methanomicrobium sp.]|nr:response regulator [Methanomicrobium sp.]
RKKERVETSPYLFSRKTIKNILVIDDEQDLCWLLSNILEGEGYNVSTANTINDGMTRLKEAPDLLFLDLKLPDGDGMDMLPRIKDIAPETFVVIISAYGSEEKKGTAEDAGVCRFLDKPFTGEQILEIIEQLSPPLPSQINKQNDTYIQIKNRWKSDQYININSGSIQCTPVESGWHSAQWAIERIQGTAYIQIRNRWKPDQYININSGSIQCTPVESGWHSAQWFFE